ncbi:TCP-1/cpn60 chaperonin family protein [Candidatus Woesearchaeota archaeon]|nr:TCP-1/cpn60 chaperonin family protein [Candidatus Woesearchaeota archaeon]
MAQQQIQPIFILPESTQRSTGKNAQRNNIMAARLVAETVRTTLGPKGMDKMLVDSLGDVVITNDGVTILKEMQIEHPSAKMLVEVAKTQENEVGDGTTTAVVIAGELLKRAETLLDQDIHPTVIAKGYRLAAEKALSVLNQMAENISENDRSMLKKISITAMTGKGAESSKEHLSEMAVIAITSIVEKDKDTEKTIIDLQNIKLEKKVGASVEESELILGLVIDKEKVHYGMPKQVRNAKIALIDAAVEIRSTETDAKIQINDPMQMQAFLDQEEKMLRDMVEKIAKTGANVVFCQKGIDDVAQHFLAKKGIYCVRRVKKSDMEALARASNGRIITNFDDLSEQDLGSAGLIEEKKIGDEMMTYVKECKNPKAVTMLLRGSTEHVAAEVKRAMEDALGGLASALRKGKIVAGAGSTEMELARYIRKYAETLSGREQLAVQAFADALEIIPRTLAENAGIDPIDILAELKASHDKGMKWAGVDVFNGKVMDAFANDVIEPLSIKTQAVSSAAEVAVMILRIDDVIAASKSAAPPMPQGGMGGMDM